MDYLLTPKAVRETTKKIFDQAARENKTHFKIHMDKLESCADFVMDVIKENYPKLDIPFHSRWGHFKIGGIDREGKLDAVISSESQVEIARKKLDLVICSVLLDAGAGKDWSYTEDGKKYSRSEGLAVASFHMFMNGKFSQNNKPQVDAKALASLCEEELEEGFQVSTSNPLVGVSGRVNLLKKLGETILNNSLIFPGQRPGGIIDYLSEKHAKEFEVKDILDAVLVGLGPIWPGRIEIDGFHLGDVWHYPPLGKNIDINSVICFHKLSQWLTYSLVTPMIQAGFTITGAQKLTGLAEYRNGGLFLDFGLIELRDSKNLTLKHLPSSELIIEWRALTVQLLDAVGEIIQKKLSKSPEEFPLAKVLEGGTWWAGRKLANEKRQGGVPPITLDSDGTVF